MADAESDPQEEKAPPKDQPVALVIALVFVGIGAGLAYATSTFVEFGVAYGVNLASFLFVAWPFHTEKFYDLTGMIAFLATGFTSILFRRVAWDDASGVRSVVLLGMVTLWTLRLGSFLFQRIVKKHGGVDARFDALRDNPCAFSAYWMGQGAWVYLLCLPLFVANSVNTAGSAITVAPSSVAPVTALDVVGWSVWVIGWAFEVLADHQKTVFKSKAENRGKFCDAGLWSITRHPNYFGEIVLWFGVAISASAVARDAGWVLWMSPGYTLFLMVFVSGVPTAEKKALEKYGATDGYAEYIGSVPTLVPFCYCWTSWVGRKRDAKDEPSTPATGLL